MLTSTFYRTRRRVAATPFGGLPAGYQTALGTGSMNLTSAEVALQTRIAPDGAPLGDLEGEAAYLEREAGNADLIGALELAVGRGRLTYSPELLSPTIDAVANDSGVIGDRIAAMIGDMSAADEVDAAVQLLGLIIDVIPPATASDSGDGLDLPVDQSATITMTSAGTETRGLPDPTFAGEVLRLVMSGSNSIAVTPASPFTDGSTSATFDANDEATTLVATADLVWRVVQSTATLA
jgi:hypothetical protein